MKGFFLATMLLLSALVSAQGTGKVKGHIALGPFKPSIRVGETDTPPPGAFKGFKVMFLQADKPSKAGTKRKTVSTAVADSGDFVATLAPGKYLAIVMHNLHTPGMRKAPTKAVVVEAGKTAVVNFSVDTGIR